MKRISEVAKFILGFKSAEDLFMNGYCYWFAVILHERFGGEIYYLPIQNHFVTRIADRYWDASGLARIDENPISWGIYQSADPLNTAHIIRDCIEKRDI